jgi:hypothetical protein
MVLCPLTTLEGINTQPTQGQCAQNRNERANRKPLVLVSASRLI